LLQNTSVRGDLQHHHQQQQQQQQQRVNIDISKGVSGSSCSQPDAALQPGRNCKPSLIPLVPTPPLLLLLLSFCPGWSWSLCRCGI
jgi:hypothetical protein